MSTLSFPTWSRSAPSQMSFSLVANTMSFSSPLTRSVQTSELPGARWAAKMTFQNLTDADVRIFKAWINKLSGMAGRFYLWDFTHPVPSGTAAGSPLVNGASQVGRTLITDGWTASQSGLLLPGDYFGVNGELKVITAPAVSDSDGNATLEFESPLRASPDNNAVITITRPTCTMMLDDDKQDYFYFTEPNCSTLSISCTEAFN